MKGRSKKYNLEKCKFRPEFNTYSKDDIDNRVASVVKEPKIQFEYNTDVTEVEAIHYGEIFRLLASFYFHSHIDYTFLKIHLPNHTITIKKIEESHKLDTHGTLWGFENYWEFDRFLNSNWQKSTLKNQKLLSKTIELFNQALLVDKNSEFLIRYNIIELCNKLKIDNKKFNEKLTGAKKKSKYQQALTLILETIESNEHEEFINKWNFVIGKLEYKPMKSPLISFLESQNLDVSEFPISINRLKQIRDFITHGSLNKIDSEELRRANILLYRINGILILNLVGIKEWKLKTELN